MTTIRKKALLKIAVGSVAYAAVFWGIYENGFSDSQIRGGVFNLMLLVGPGLPLFMGIVELLFNASFSDVSAKWDGLKGWQRGVLGMLVVILAFSLMVGFFLATVFTGVL